MAIQDKKPKGMTRRDFVKSSTVIGAALFAPSVLIKSANSKDRAGMVDAAFKENSAEMKCEESLLSKISVKRVFRLTDPKSHVM